MISGHCSFPFLLAFVCKIFSLAGWFPFIPKSKQGGSCFVLLCFVRGWHLPSFRLTLSVGVREEASGCSFLGGEGKGEGVKAGMTGCRGEAVSSRSSHRTQGDDSLRVVLKPLHVCRAHLHRGLEACG